MSFSTAAFAVETFADSPAAHQVFVAMEGRAELTVERQRILRATNGRNFTTSSLDTPAGKTFSQTLVQPLSFRRALSQDGFGGLIEGQGNIVLANTDGRYDFLPQRYATDGREVTIRYGRRSDQYSSRMLAFRGLAGAYHADEDDVRVPLHDFMDRLDVPLTTKTYAGTGGAEGGVDLRGKRKPRCFGYCLNISAPQLSASSLLYLVNAGPVQAITAVYSRGIVLGSHGDYPSVAALLATSIPAGRFATCLVEGLFRINFSLQSGDIITADVLGDADGGFVSSVGSIVQRMVLGATDLTAVDLYSPSFARLELDHPHDVGHWFDHNDNSTVAQAILRVLGFGRYAGFRRDGRLMVGQFSIPSGPPRLYLNRSNMATTPRRLPLPEGLNPPPHSWLVPYSVNHTVITDPASGTSDDRRAFLQERERIVSTENAAVRYNHPQATERRIEAFYRLAASARAEGQRLSALHSPSRSLYELTTKDMRGLTLDLGDCVHVTDKRFDLATGRLLRVLETDDDGAAGTVRIVGYG